MAYGRKRAHDGHTSRLRTVCCLTASLGSLPAKKIFLSLLTMASLLHHSQTCRPNPGSRVFCPLQHCRHCRASSTTARSSCCAKTTARHSVYALMRLFRSCDEQSLRDGTESQFQPAHD